MAYSYSNEQSLQLLDAMAQAMQQFQPVRLEVMRMAEKLKVERARQFAISGIGRRLSVIARSATNIFEIYPPNRVERLSVDDCTDISILFQAFAINVYGVFDNASWVAVLEAGGKLKNTDVGPYKKLARPFFPQPFSDYLDQKDVHTWFHEYGKPYRDSTAHRIAPYLPPAILNPEEAKKREILQQQQRELLDEFQPGDSLEVVKARIAASEALDDEMQKIGVNSILIANSSGDEDGHKPIKMHPQIISDIGLMRELITVFCDGMKAKCQF